MEFENIISQIEEQIDSPIDLGEGKIRWKGQVYELMPYWAQETFQPPKLELPSDKNELRGFLGSGIIMASLWILYAFVNTYPPATIWDPIFGYLSIPLLLSDLVGKWYGQWRLRNRIVPFQNFPGMKEEWIEMVKREAFSRFWPGTLDTNRCTELAIAITGRKETILGLGLEEIKAYTTGICSVGLCFQFTLMLVDVRKAPNPSLGSIYFGCSIFWAFLAYLTFIIAMDFGRCKEFYAQAARLRNGCKVDSDEEKGEWRESGVELRWMIEQLLLVQEDSEERAQERRKALVDPILTEYLIPRVETRI